jgi:hypothetical protein
VSLFVVRPFLIGTGVAACGGGGGVGAVALVDCVLMLVVYWCIVLVVYRCIVLLRSCVAARCESVPPAFWLAVVGAGAPPPEAAAAFAGAYFLFFKAHSQIFGVVWWPEA